MALYDITLPLHQNHPPWPGDTPFEMERASSIASGDECNVSRIVMSSHFGTHLDAPFHFENDGIKVDQLALETLIGKALVCEIDSHDLIQPGHLPNLEGVERLLCKTPNGEFIDDTQFHQDYTAVSNDAAKAMVEAGIKLLGIDYFSIEAFHSPGHPVHHTLCGNGVILLEGLDLRNIKPGWYELIALPLKLKDGDGSPCRVILRDLP